MNRDRWGFYDTYLRNPYAEENSFRGMEADTSDLPTLEVARDLLPSPFWNGHQSAIDCYWKVWEIAFRNLRKPQSGSPFVANFIATAFNDCLFMWDSAFILLFARYGNRAFNFQRTLDNLYSTQHPDGFICREIGEADGLDRFQRFDPTSTGPNIMPWTEWEYYQTTGDRGRLTRVFPVLTAYHQWMRKYHTWNDGTYWSSGWGCGMDNQPRFPIGDSINGENEVVYHHGFLVWADACFQQMYSCSLLINMAEALGRGVEVEDLRAERERLHEQVNDLLWDEAKGFYYDRFPDSSLSTMTSIGAYWSLLADAVPSDRLARFVSHLENTGEFNRMHRVPTLAADHPQYADDGGYWKGGVWAPTNYMVLRGLTRAGYDDLAHDIGMNHHRNVVKVYERTGTVWENYAPELVSPGNPAKSDFVGWSGLPPVAVLFEYVFGIQADAPANKVRWDVRLLEEHGVERYPFGADVTINLRCDARGSITEKPNVRVESSAPVMLELRWQGGSEIISVG